MAKPTPAPFEFSELLPLGADNTQYRFLGSEGVSTFETSEGTFLKVDPAAIILLTEHAMRDILRTSWLTQKQVIMIASLPSIY
jgi:fumarate hydratase class I